VPGTNLLWWGEREAQGGLIAAQDHLGNARTDAQGRATFLLVDRTRHGQEEGWTGTGYRWDVRGLLGRNASSPPYQAPEYAWPPALDAWDFVVPGYATVTVTVTVAGDPMAGRPVTVSGVRRRGEEVEESPGQTRPTDEAGRVELLLVDNASDGQADGWTGVGYRFKASTGHGDLWSHDLAPDEPFYKPAFGYPPATGAYLFEIPHGLVETTVTLAYRGDPVPDKGVGVNAYHRDADREVRSTLLYRRTDWPTDEAGQVRFRLWSDYQRFVPEGFDFAIPFGLVDLTTVVTLRGQPLTDSQVGIRWCYRVPDHDVLSPHQRHDIIARTDDAGRARHTLPDDYGVHLEAGQEFVGYLVEVETLLGWIVHRHCRPDAFLPQPGGYPPVPERLDLPFPSGIVESTVTVTLAGDPVPGVPVTVSALRRNAIFELRSDSFSPLTTDEAGRITRRLWDDYQPFVPEGDTFLEYGFSTTVAEIPLYSWQCGLDPYHPGPGGWPPVAEQHELAFPFGRAEVTVIVTQGGESVVSATLEARAVSRVDGIVREMHRGTRTTDEDGRGRFHLWSIPHPHLPDYEGLGFRFSANVDGQTHDSHEAAGPFYVPPDYGYPPQPNDYAFAIP